jgi:hypothetical protein
MGVDGGAGPATQSGLCGAFIPFIIRRPFSHGEFVWAVTMNQYLFGGPTILPRLSGMPRAWFRCGSSKTPQRRDMICRLVFD